MSGRGLGARHRRIRRVVLAQAGGVCHWCGGPANTADHLRERARGGGATIDNYVAACTTCNSRRGGLLAAELRRARHRHPFFGGAHLETPPSPSLSPPTPPTPPFVVTDDGTPQA